VPSKHAVVFYSDDVVRVVGVVVFQVEQDVQLHASLVLKTLFVSYNLYRNDLACFVVFALQGLAERSFAEELEHFVSEIDLVF